MRPAPTPAMQRAWIAVAKTEVTEGQRGRPVRRGGQRVQALGGAKNHAVVLPDADLDMTADALVSAAYGSAGERCMALPVVCVEESIADELVEAVVELATNLKMGPAWDPATDLGPLGPESVGDGRNRRLFRQLDFADNGDAVSDLEVEPEQMGEFEQARLSFASPKERIGIDRDVGKMLAVHRQMGEGFGLAVGAFDVRIQ